MRLQSAHNKELKQNEPVILPANVQLELTYFQLGP